MASWLERLPPGYFALVMATGTLAIACDQEGVRLAAQALYLLAALAYVVLIVLLVARAVHYPRAVGSDLTHHESGFSFLTTVAATNVLGSGSAIVHGWWGVAWALWWVSLPLLAVGIYVPLIAVVMRQSSPGLLHGINGTWFLLTVALESVVVLAGLLLGRSGGDLLAFLALAAFGLGLVLYLVVMTLIFLRWTLYRLDPTEIHPPAWIAAGAVAITTLAGSNLLVAATSVERLARLTPFIEGVTLLAWGTATFWFPVMVAVGAWRHLFRRVPLTYDPSLWAMVFPLAMYAAATYRLLEVTAVPHLDALHIVAFAIAALAWTATAAGFALHSLARARPAPSRRG